MKNFTCLLLILFLLPSCVPAVVMQADRAVFEATPQEWSVQQGVAGENIDVLLALTPDAHIHKLVQQALSGNPELAIAALRLKEAEMILRQIRAEQLPQWDATLTGLRTRSAGQKPENQFSAGMNLSWEIDLWGRLQAATNAEELEQQAIRGDLDEVRTGLAGQVMKSWLELVSSKRTLQLEEARIKNLEIAEMMILERYQNGIGNIDDLNAAKTAKAFFSAEYKRQQERHQSLQRFLNVLLGDFPEADFNVPIKLPLFRLPAAGLPADVVGRRPDIQSAYHRIQAADQKTVVAYKQLLPGFRLSFDLSDSRNSFSDLLKGSPAWNLLGSLTAPLFHGGQLRAEAKRQEYGAEAAFWDYRQVLLRAFLEIENCLDKEESLKVQEVEMIKAEQYADASYQKHKHLYWEGMTDIVILLTTERAAYTARINKINTEKERLVNRVDLALSLGIGF